MTFAIGKDSTNVVLERIFQQFIWDKLSINPHLQLQIQFLNNKEILEKLQYVLPYSSSGAGLSGGHSLTDALTKVVGDLFAKSPIKNWSHANSKRFNPILLQKMSTKGKARDRMVKSYNAGEKNAPILDFFRNLHPHNVSDDILQIIKKTYFLDLSSFAGCGFASKTHVTDSVALVHEDAKAEEEHKKSQ